MTRYNSFHHYCTIVLDLQICLSNVSTFSCFILYVKIYYTILVLWIVIEFINDIFSWIGHVCLFTFIYDSSFIIRILTSIIMIMIVIFLIIIMKQHLAQQPKSDKDHQLQEQFADSFAWHCIFIPALIMYTYNKYDSACIKILIGIEETTLCSTHEPCTGRRHAYCVHSSLRQSN